MIQHNRCPVPLLAGEFLRHVFPSVTLIEPRIVGQIHANVTAPSYMFLNGQPVAVNAEVGQTIPQVAECIMGEGSLVITNVRIVFVSPTYGLSVHMTDVLGLSGTEDDVTIIRNGLAPVRLCCQPGRAIARGIVASFAR